MNCVCAIGIVMVVQCTVAVASVPKPMTPWALEKPIDYQKALDLVKQYYAEAVEHKE